MKTCLSALEIHYLIKELQFLINAKIDKIYHPSKKELILQFHVPNKGRQQLKINEKVIYLTSHKFPAETPSDFCMFLRKKLTNARLRKIRQLEFERIIEFEFEAKDGKYSLFFELFSKGNIILTKNNKILTAAEYQKWKDRIIKPKQDYSYPRKEYNLLKLNQSNIKDLLTKTNKESIVKCLAIDLGLGGIYAEEVCLLANLDKNKKPSKIDQKKLFKTLKQLKNKKLDPRIIYKKKEIQDIVQFELKYYKNLKQKRTPSFNQALDSYFSKEIEITKKAEFEKKLEKIRNIIKKQESQIKELERSEKENKQKAELLYQNYKLINNLLTELKEISKKHNWKEIKEKLKGHKIIKQVIPSEKSIIIELK